MVMVRVRVIGWVVVRTLDVIGRGCLLYTSDAADE